MAEDNTQDVQRQKDLNLLKHSYLMYEQTKKESEKRMRQKLNENGDRMYSDADIARELETINIAEADIIQKYLNLGGTEEELKTAKRTPRKHTGKSITELLDKYEAEDKAKAEYVNNLTKERDLLAMREDERQETSQLNLNTETVNEIKLTQKTENNPQATYDVIPIPSNGECYRSKINRVPVAYLTAYDENMIIAPNLYRDNKIIDMILKEKVLDGRIDTYDMLEGDREAIVIFLRASGYGNEYPITAKDNETGVEFDTVFDLSKLKFRPFKLKGDENGWFDYTLPVSKKQIKFRFLTHKDLVLLDKMEKEEDRMAVKGKIKEYVEDLDRFVEDDENLEKSERVKIKQAIRALDDWQEEMEDDEPDFTHSVTNRLELSIMAVDGITDRKMVREFIRNMNVRDSSSLRKYITENEPGIDYNVEVEKPESLGGGSMKVFLQLDQYLFLNIA